jgi:hypothetical protein
MKGTLCHCGSFSKRCEYKVLWNIKVESDGYLGSVNFNYSDHRNGIEKAFGTEAWDLIKDESGWKIVSVKYTVTEAR